MIIHLCQDLFLHVMSEQRLLQQARKGRNGVQSNSKRQILHRDTREVEEGLLSRMHRPRGGRDAARGGDGAALQRWESQERRHRTDGGHVPSDQAPGPAAALCVLHKQALGAAL